MRIHDIIMSHHIAVTAEQIAYDQEYNDRCPKNSLYAMTSHPIHDADPYPHW